MDQKYKQLFQRLDYYMKLQAPSRKEQPVADALKEGIKKHIFQITYDKTGSIIFSKKSKKTNVPKVVIAAHMDEVGYMIKSIKENGNILVSSIGGIWASSIIGTKAIVESSKTKQRFNGVFGHTSVHIMTKEKYNSAMTNDELYVDLGFKSDKEVYESNLNIGDSVYITGETIVLENNLVGGKAMDNRAGITALEFIANQIADVDLGCDVYLVGTTQEEVGSRGAKSMINLIKPDIAFALDICASRDTFMAIEGIPVLGRGAAILVKDGGIIPDPKLINFISKIAKSNGINTYKYIAAGGFTDSSELQFPDGGCSALTISIPQRYLHSPIGVASLFDIQSSIDLLVLFLKSLSKEVYDELFLFK
ncbi:M42 family metallopeptidase [Mycoplasmopsis cynos]|nr:M42 family metallopeptidase [Mycoplasmopsis cynos]